MVLLWIKFSFSLCHYLFQLLHKNPNHTTKDYSYPGFRVLPIHQLSKKTWQTADILTVRFYPTWLFSLAWERLHVLSFLLIFVWFSIICQIWTSDPSMVSWLVSWLVCWLFLLHFLWFSKVGRKTSPLSRYW